MNEYEESRKAGLYGFAHAYLHQCDKKSKTGDEIDIQVYTKLVKLDSKIGTTASEQLYCCLHCTTRSDIIEVLPLFLIHAFKSIQTINFEQVDDYEDLRKGGAVGFAHVYLDRFHAKSKSDYEIDIHVHCICSLSNILSNLKATTSFTTLYLWMNLFRLLLVQSIRQLPPTTPDFYRLL